ncbi:MAG: cobalt transporter CbiM [Dehalococcoidia bacterium]|nr:cobalt transporter CbiM [Dehalococcoidia bacterium]
MHIPDGYLSPVTCAVMYAASTPFWAMAARRTRELMASRMVPLLSVFSAFAFVIMMFNIPLPGGTSGHAVGGTLIAVVLGPWAAIVGVSVALLIQAVFFGDGGILTFGANAFNMAIVLPMVGYGVYRLIAGGSPASSWRRVAGAGIGGYLGLNAGAFFTAVEFGLQPLLFHTADGTPLYSPFGLSTAIPAMMVPHLLVAGVAEAVVTVLVVRYLQASHPALLEKVTPEQPATALNLRWLWGMVAALVILSPLGLLAPGTAWGEWGTDQLEGVGLTFIPQGLEQLEGFWSAPLAEYSLGTWEPILAYALSGAIGVLVIAFITWLLTRQRVVAPRTR